MCTTLSQTSPLTLTAQESVVIVPGAAQGTLMGGNLTTLCHLIGTPFSPNFKNKILFLEDIGEAPYKLDRMLFQMKMAGIFNEISGVALGSFSDCGNQADVLKVLVYAFEDMKTPVIGGFQAGHGPVNQTFPIGLEACLDSDKATLTFMAPAVI